MNNGSIHCFLYFFLVTSFLLPFNYLSIQIHTSVSQASQNFGEQKCFFFFLQETVHYKILHKLLPCRHTTFKQHWIKVDSISWFLINIWFNVPTMMYAHWIWAWKHCFVKSIKTRSNFTEISQCNLSWQNKETVCFISNLRLIRNCTLIRDKSQLWPTVNIGTKLHQTQWSTLLVGFMWKGTSSLCEL